jgi:LAGLIDADG endonuclease
LVRIFLENINIPYLNSRNILYSENINIKSESESEGASAPEELHLIKSNYNFGPYLAGLIEGDGSIYVPKLINNEYIKRSNPNIRIVFHIKDLKLGEYLQSLLKGKIQKPKKKNYIL